jgi:hypothetical protein
MKTIKVRIALAVDADGDWCANGWSTKSDPKRYEEDAFGCAVENIADGEARYWIEADVQVPEKITGTVKATVIGA